MGIIKVTKTHPNGTVEVEEIDTNKLEKPGGKSKRRGPKERKPSTGANKTVSCD